MIKYNKIINIFNKEEWDFSYLTHQEIWEILNHPVKLEDPMDELILNKNPFNKNCLFLVCIKKTENFDYTFLSEFIKNCKNTIPELNISKFWCNYKYAAVRAGLGQYAKNSLFYHPKFQFETHIGVFLIKNQIIELPQRNKPNFRLLPQCKNCNDCILSCPVQAIHYENNQTWINLCDCDNFCSFGNHPKIPSLKWNWFTLDDELSSYFTDFEKIYNIKSYYNLKQISKKINSQQIIINNEIYNGIFPICRECTSQPKCSKYNGNYPYNWNDITLIKQKE